MMPFPWQAAASALGGVLGFTGQQDANRTNIRLARENREWQERMSNSAVTRRFADLDRAGVNPMLAGQFDATTPPGSLATVGNAGSAGVMGATGGASVARDISTLPNDIKLLQERIGLTDKQTKVLGLVAEASSNAGEFLGALIDKAKQFNLTELDISNMVESLPQAMKSTGSRLLEEISNLLNNANELVLDGFDSEWGRNDSGQLRLMRKEQ
ncbi:DNA pilot protein [Microviridae sp.]|nr:DNA pilot protein [Microviridae sp.]